VLHAMIMSLNCCMVMQSGNATGFFDVRLVTSLHVDTNDVLHATIMPVSNLLHDNATG